MTLLTSQPSGLPRRCFSGHLTLWTTFCACATSSLCSSASVSSQVVGLKKKHKKTIILFYITQFCFNVPGSFWRFILLYFTSGIPFMYRGLPCIYSSAILASASLLSGGNMALLRVIAIAMIVFMISQNFYPHDRVLESQAWKKVIYAGGDFFYLVEQRHCLMRWWQLERHWAIWQTWPNMGSYYLLGNAVI